MDTGSEEHPQARFFSVRILCGVAIRADGSDVSHQAEVKFVELSERERCGDSQYMCLTMDSQVLFRL